MLSCFGVSFCAVFTFRVSKAINLSCLGMELLSVAWSIGGDSTDDLLLLQISSGVA